MLHDNTLYRTGLTWSVDGALTTVVARNGAVVDGAVERYVAAVARALGSGEGALWQPVPLGQLKGEPEAHVSQPSIARRVTQEPELASADDASTGVRDFLAACKQQRAVEKGGERGGFGDVAAACASHASRVHSLLEGVQKV